MASEKDTNNDGDNGLVIETVLPLRVSAGISRLKGRGSRILASMAAMKHNRSNALIMVGRRFLLVEIEFPPGAFKPDASNTFTHAAAAVDAARARACVRRTLHRLSFLRIDQGEIDARLTNIQSSLMVTCSAVNTMTI